MLIALEVLAVIVTAISWLPQWWRAVRCASAQSLSRAAWAQAAALGGTWAIWGVRADVWSMALSEGAFALGCLVILAAVLPRGRFAACALTALTVAAAAAVWLPAAWLSAGGLLGSAGVRGAQLAKVLRTRTAVGVSSTTWALLALSGTAWGGVGVLTGAWPLVVGAVMGVVGALLIAGAANRVAGSPAA